MEPKRGRTCLDKELYFLPLSKVQYFPLSKQDYCKIYFLTLISISKIYISGRKYECSDLSPIGLVLRQRHISFKFKAWEFPYGKRKYKILEVKLFYIFQSEEYIHCNWSQGNFALFLWVRSLYTRIAILCNAVLTWLMLPWLMKKPTWKLFLL